MKSEQIERRCHWIVAPGSKCFRRAKEAVAGRELCTQHSKMQQKKLWVRGNVWHDRVPLAEPQTEIGKGER